jgi:hypothetical protein
MDAVSASSSQEPVGSSPKKSRCFLGCLRSWGFDRFDLSPIIASQVRSLCFVGGYRCAAMPHARLRVPPRNSLARCLIADTGA